MPYRQILSLSLYRTTEICQVFHKKLKDFSLPFHFSPPKQKPPCLLGKTASFYENLLESLKLSAIIAINSEFVGFPLPC